MSDLTKATLPVTAVVAIVVAGLGYWVNAQDGKIVEAKAETREVAARVKDNEKELAEQKLQVVEDLGTIKTEQALSKQRQELILQAIQELKE